MADDLVIKRKTTATLIFPPCKICSGKATGIHFGVNTCESCKAFFRRAIGDKNKYKCLVSGNCEILDRKRGNCSACRYQKCLDQGMSRNAVRHGRYTIAIRTKTIMEAKEQSRKRKGDSIELDCSSDSNSSSGVVRSSESNQSQDSPCSQSDCSITFQTAVFCSPHSSQCNGDSSSMQPDSTTSFYGPSGRKSARILEKQPPQLREMIQQKCDESVQHEMSEDEILLMIQTLLAAQSSIYPHFIMYWDQDHIDKLQKNFFDQRKLEQQIFGVKSYLSKQEFDSVYQLTGIDADGRLAYMKKVVTHVQKSILKYIMFAKNIPGFLDLSNDDKIALIRAARFEYWLLGHFRHFNSKLGAKVGHEIGMTKEDSHRLFGNSLANIDILFDFCESLMKLNISYEENAVLRGIVILFRDRCPLKEADKVEALQWKLIQCLKYLIKKRHPHNSTRRFTDFINKLVAMRDLTEINKQHNKRLEGFHLDIVRNHQLVYECLMHEDSEKEEGQVYEGIES